MKIGFVGLGKMGTGIARNLLRAGNELTVYNRSREKAEALTKEGASVADSPAQVAQESEAVFSMVPDDHAAEEITLGADGIAAGLAKNAIHISSSTISIDESRRLEQRHKQSGSRFIAAPVFGRPEAAESKKLLVMAAGNAQAVEKCMPLFDAMGRRTFVIGEEPWQANLLKLCGNFMIASMLETFGEACAAIRKAGANHHEFYEIMSELFGSPVYKNYGKAIADQTFEPAGFELKLGFKDVRLAMEAAAEFNAPLPIANVLRDHFLSALAHGQEKLDWSSVALVSARSAGLNS